MKKQNLKSKSQVHSFLNQAQEAYEAMEYLKAVDFYKKALKIKEEDESTLNSLGRCFDQYALTLKDKNAQNLAQKKLWLFIKKRLR